MTPTPSAVPTPTPSPTPTFDMAALSIDDPASIWVVADKLRPLNPADYVPADLVEVPVAHTNDPLLRQEPSDAVVAMFQAAQAEAGLALASNSAYRSYETQVRVYQRDIDNSARSSPTRTRRGPDTASTRPVWPWTSVRSRAAARWIRASRTPLRASGSRRMPGGSASCCAIPPTRSPVTGYTFEPWHYRYIGVALSTEMHDTGVTTLEEFFGLPAAPGYP